MLHRISKEVMVMVKVRCVDSWQSQYTEGKEYIVKSSHYPYILVVDDMGNSKWEYMKNFEELTVWFVDERYKFKVNWEVL